MAREDEDDNTKLKIHKLHVVSDLASKVISDIFKYGTLIFLIYTGGEVLLAYSGEITIADVSFSWMINDHLGDFLGVIFGAGGILYGRQQSKLRRDAIENMYPDKLQSQLGFDPGRTSSGLTNRGDTQEED